jgi:FlaA1/EpsC-like NDP-sugar epimerase
MRAKGGQMSPLLGDIRDLDRLRFAMDGVEVVFHTAALKHVGLGEYNPFEVVQTNLQGLNNVIRASLDANVSRFIFTSSDKAVNPTNVMGASKLMGERLVTAANEIRGLRATRFASVRFGNVLGSRGSVLPIFVRQLRSGKPVTLTDEAMTRYVMTIEEAGALVLEAGARMLGGEVFVAKMRALRIVDLARAVADIVLGKPCDFVRTGPRPGEKLFEELVSPDEIARTVELDRLLIILPPTETSFEGRPTLASYPDGRQLEREWHSGRDRLLTPQDIGDYLRQASLELLSDKGLP